MRVHVLLTGAQSHIHAEKVSRVASDFSIPDAGDGKLPSTADLTPDLSLFHFAVGHDNGKAVLDRLRHALPGAKVIVAAGTRGGDMISNRLVARALEAVSEPPRPRPLPTALVVVQPEPSTESHAYRRDASLPGCPPLTQTEEDVVRRVVRGKTDKEIARDLYVSRRTVQNYLSRIRAKTGLHRRAELAIWAGQALRYDRSREQAPA